MEREIEKIGDLAEIVKVQAEVYLRCGERLYAPEVAKHLAKIRSKLQKEAMVNPQKTARERLLDKLDYEVWFLDFLEKRYDMVSGKFESPVIELASGKPTIQMSFADFVFSDEFLLNAMMPLMFIASFKTLDMVFE